MKLFQNSLGSPNQSRCCTLVKDDVQFQLNFLWGVSKKRRVMIVLTSQDHFA